MTISTRKTLSPVGEKKIGIDKQYRPTFDRLAINVCCVFSGVSPVLAYMVWGVCFFFTPFFFFFKKKIILIFFTPEMEEQTLLYSPFKKKCVTFFFAFASNMSGMFCQK